MLLRWMCFPRASLLYLNTSFLWVISLVWLKSKRWQPWEDVCPVRWEVLPKWGPHLVLERLFRCRFIPHIPALSAAAGWELLSLTAPDERLEARLHSALCCLLPVGFLNTCTYLLLTCFIQCANCSDDPNTHKYTHTLSHTPTHT